MEAATTRVRTVRFTPAQKKQLERLCNNRMNWTDGGHWNGFGKAPNCSAKESISNTRTHNITFSTDAAAFKWNQGYEDAIRQMGHVATAVITVTVALTTGGTAGIVVGTLAAVFKDEVQARVKYPKVARGWKYVLKVTRSSQWSPHPYGKNGFTIEAVGKAYDHKGRLQYSASSITKFDYDEIPIELAERIANFPTKTTSSVYR